MRYILIIILFLVPITLFAVTGEDVRFDWELGEPAVTLNATLACTDTAVARADWVLGEPTVVFDATATCTAVVAPAAVADPGVIWFTAD